MNKWQFYYKLHIFLHEKILFLPTTLFKIFASSSGEKVADLFEQIYVADAFRQSSVLIETPGTKFVRDMSTQISGNCF